MKKDIEITTTQHVTITYELARLRERFMALFLDYLFVFIGFYIFFALFSALFPSMLASRWSGVVLGLMPIILLLAYFFLFEMFNRGQTPAKRLLNIRVVRIDGKAIEWMDALLRSVLLVVDVIFSMGIIGATLIRTTKNAQRFGDLAANTTVIKLENHSFSMGLKDILNIHSLQNYTPQFPQVRELSEKDMLFIKSVLMRYQKYPNEAHENAIYELTQRIMHVLDIERVRYEPAEFLRVLLKDYVALTR